MASAEQYISLGMGIGAGAVLIGFTIAHLICHPPEKKLTKERMDELKRRGLL